MVSDLSTPGEAEKLIASRPALIFHLAAVVSGEAEADFEKGYRVNLDGTRRLFEAIRKERQRATGRRVVFTSSIAVFGAPFPEAIGDEFLNAPLTSYGTQKAIGELLLSDYSRRGFFDGIGIRLPTICVRPGQAEQGGLGLLLRHHPRAARGPGGGAAGARERAPLVRLAARRHRLPAACLRRLDTAKLGTRRNLSMPGVCATVGEQIEALRKVAGDKAARLIRREPDPDHHAHRRGLAAQLRRETRARARLPRRSELRGNHPDSHRG